MHLKNSKHNVQKALYACLFLVAFFLPATISGQQNEGFKNINSEQGLPSSECYYIMQDSKGYIWISTSAGVTRYNGKELKTYTKNNGLTDNAVFSTYEDKKGRIWFRTFSGALCYYLNDSIYSIACNKELVAALNKNTIAKLIIDEFDNLWCSMYGSANFIKIDKTNNYSKLIVVKNDPSKFHIKAFSNNPPLFSALNTNADPESTTLNMQTADFSGEVRLPKISPAVFPHVLLIDTSEFIISDGLNGIHYYKKGIYKKMRFTNRIINIFKDKEGYIWVSEYKKGIYRYSLNNLSKPLLHLLDGYSITSLCEDYEGGIWFSALENGVFYKRNLENQPYHYQDYQASTSIRFFKKLGDYLFIGTDQPSVIIIDKELNSNKADLGKTSSGYIVNDLTVYGSNYYLSAYSTLKVFDKDFKLKTEISKVNDRFSKSNQKNSNFRQIIFVSDSGFLLNDGFSISSIINFDAKYKIELPSRITRFAYDSINKTIYVGTKSGLFIINKDHQLIPVSLPGLEESAVTSFYQYKNKNFAVSQQNGVFLLSGDKFIKIFSEKNVILNNICIDTNENIWLSSNKGIVILKPNGKGYDHSILSKADGLQSDEINYITYYNNKIWYASSNGVYYFDPVRFIKQYVSPKTEIEYLRINDKKYPSTNIGSLDHDQNNITIKASCLSFLPGSESSLLYRLIGYDSIWKNSGSENLLNYTNLPSGKYELQVKGINCKNIDSNQIKSVSFTIEPAFWKTWWFILLEIIAGILLVILLTLSYLNRGRKKEQEKNRINQLLSEYQMTALRAQINPHFIFNCLSSIQVLILKEDIDKAYMYLQKFSKLLRLVLENSKRNFTSLGEELEVVELYVELEQLRFENSFKFTINTDPSIDPSKITVPYMILQPIVENAIWHGLMHSDKKVKDISIKINGKENRLIIEIIDNGIGREKSRKYKAEARTSMGENITTERLNLFNMEKNEKASIEINDLYEDDKPSGTLVKIIIPQ